MRRVLFFAFLSLSLAIALSRADGPMDNIPEKVRPIPPKGIPLSQETIGKLKVELLAVKVALYNASEKLPPAKKELLSDAEIYYKSVDNALNLDEFHAPAEVGIAHKQLAEAQARIKAITSGDMPWAKATGLVVRGYRSKIDGSSQPYGLVVPKSYRADGTKKYRLDIWCHGRGEKLSEVAFIDQRQRSAGEFTPPDTIVLHPYGRYCNANKFAGEIDVLVAIEHCKRHYRIDEDRIVMRGFSMGGAACWQFAAHYPDRWVAAAPGAGFSETPEFLRVFQNETVTPTDYERKLWQLYDCPGYAANFHNLPLVAYSGEKDRQKQAADVMEKALTGEGIKMVHLIGPKTDHKYHPETKVEINRRIDRIAERGRERVPPRVRFTTFTLRYDRSFWVKLDRLGEHWKKAHVDATLTRSKYAIEAKTMNVTALTFAFDSGDCPSDITGTPKILIDGQELTATAVMSDRSWITHLLKTGEKWAVVAEVPQEGKRHALQGPIDDAFMDRFLFVRPTEKPIFDKVGNWVNSEMDRAILQWRKHFRGEPRVVEDRAVTERDIAESNLVLWGDPASNLVMKKLADKLPISWTAKEIRKFGSEDHALILIAPNPLNAKRYVVLNSGFTFREYDYLNNARQVPKLPDWAIIDVRVPPNARTPGKVVEAGFFNEEWKLK
jgi:dienelactone hydrolase